MADESNREVGAGASPALPTGWYATALGLAPLLFVALVTSALLWGIGKRLPFTGAWKPTGGHTDVREAIGWLAGVAILLTVANPIIRVVARGLQGYAPWAPAPLIRYMTRRQERLRESARSAASAIPDDAAWIASQLVDHVRWCILTAFEDVRDTPTDRLRTELNEALEAERPALTRHLQEDPGALSTRGAAYFTVGLAQLISRELLGGPYAMGGELSQAIEARASTPWKPYPKPLPNYPSKSAVRATSLANIQAALAERIDDRYGAELDLLWPRLLMLLPQDDREDITSAERHATIPLTQAAGWYLGTILAVVTATVYFSASPLLGALALGAFLLGRSAHLRAMGGARSYAAKVESSFDVHRLSLLEAFGWRRPEDAEEERRMFMSLSRLLSGEGAGPDASWRKTDLESATPLIEGVRRSIEETVDSSVRPAVLETLRSAVAGPRLANFDGHVAADVLEDGVALLANDEHGVLLSRGRSHEIRVSIGHEQMDGAVSARVRVRGGDDRPSVTFMVSVDSNVPGFQHPGTDLTVSADTPTSTMALPLDPAEPAMREEEAWLWIRVSQEGRTLQHLELTTHFAAEPGPAPKL